MRKASDATKSKGESAAVGEGSDMARSGRITFHRFAGARVANYPALQTMAAKQATEDLALRDEWAEESWVKLRRAISATLRRRGMSEREARREAERIVVILRDAGVRAGTFGFSLERTGRTARKPLTEMPTKEAK